MSKEVKKIHIPNLKQLIKEHQDNDAIFETLDYCIQNLTPPTADKIIKELTLHYKDWFKDFVKIEIDHKGIYAIRNAKVEGYSRWIIFSIVQELFETHVNSHLTLEQIYMCSSFFMDKVVK